LVAPANLDSPAAEAAESAEGSSPPAELVPLGTPQEESSGATSEIVDVEGITLEVPTLPEEETNEIGAPEVGLTNTGAELPPGDQPPTTMLPAEATIYRLETVRDADSSDADDWPESPDVVDAELADREPAFCSVCDVCDQNAEDLAPERNPRAPFLTGSPSILWANATARDPLTLDHRHI
jgi:hypothetical protein